jgi:hypothetical protein
MTATLTTSPVATSSTSSTSSTTSGSPTRSARTRPVLRTGLVAGAAAAVATGAYAAIVHAAGVSFEVGGEAIPAVGFAQVTFVLSLVGIAIAAICARRAKHPARTFLRTTIALTMLSFVPDVLADASTSTRVALALSHVVAAAIVIPALSSRLAD